MSTKLLSTRLLFLALVALVALASCGDDNDAVSQAERATLPTPIPAPNATDASGQELSLTVVDGGEATGLVIADHRGRAVYGATGATTDKLVCLNDCTSAWIPLAPRDNAVAPGLDLELFAVFKRPNGQQQVSYADVPLYTWTGDSEVGITGGAGVAGIWFALTAAGGFVE